MEGGAEGVKLIVRGDCCCHRAIAWHKDLFGGAPQVTSDEKSRSDFLLDHLVVGSATRRDLEEFLDFHQLSQVSAQYRYTMDQLTRNTLTVSDADLVLIDDYADMNFRAWEHRERGWKVWVHPRFVTDQERFEEMFEPIGQLSLAASVDHLAALIEHYRYQNGSIPVLFMHQPVVYYPKLEERGTEFEALGPALRDVVPDLYIADLPDPDWAERADPVEAGGPDHTLHFTGATYRVMLDRAFQQGLAERLASGSV